MLYIRKRICGSCICRRWIRIKGNSGKRITRLRWIRISGNRILRWWRRFGFCFGFCFMGLCRFLRRRRRQCCFWFLRRRRKGGRANRVAFNTRVIRVITRLNCTFPFICFRRKGGRASKVAFNTRLICTSLPFISTIRCGCYLFSRSALKFRLRHSLYVGAPSPIWNTRAGRKRPWGWQRRRRPFGIR